MHMFLYWFQKSKNNLHRKDLCFIWQHYNFRQPQNQFQNLETVPRYQGKYSSIFINGILMKSFLSKTKTTSNLHYITSCSKTIHLLGGDSGTSTSPCRNHRMRQTFMLLHQVCNDVTSNSTH